MGRETIFSPPCSLTHLLWRHHSCVLFLPVGEKNKCFGNAMNGKRKRPVFALPFSCFVYCFISLSAAVDGRSLLILLLLLFIRINERRPGCIISSSLISSYKFLFVDHPVVFFCTAVVGGWYLLVSSSSFLGRNVKGAPAKRKWAKVKPYKIGIALDSSNIGSASYCETEVIIFASVTRAQDFPTPKFCQSATFFINKIW